MQVAIKCLYIVSSDLFNTCSCYREAVEPQRKKPGPQELVRTDKKGGCRNPLSFHRKFNWWGVRNKSRIIFWMNLQRGEMILLQSPPLFPRSHQTDKRGLTPPKTSLVNQRENPHIRKQTAVSISHLQYPRCSETTKRYLEHTGCTSTRCPCGLVPSHATSPAATRTGCCASPLTHRPDNTTRCGSRLVPELAINTLLLLLIQLGKSKSAASKIGKLKKKKKNTGGGE